MTERETTAAIVLAGGASSRFGGDKLSADLDRRPLLHHALVAVDELVGTIVLVLAPGAATPELPPLRAHVLVAHDTATHQGPLAGLSAGLAALPPPVDRAVLIGGDMPSLVPAVLGQLLDLLDADPTIGVALLAVEPMRPLPMGVRPAIVAPAVAALLAEDRRALRGVVAQVPGATIPAEVWRALDPDGRTLRDVDSPEDLHHR